MRVPALLFALILSWQCLASGAWAQPSGIFFGEDGSWFHPPTGHDFPAQMLGLKPERVTQFEENEDVVIEYRDADKADLLTIHLFRNVSGNVPIWFDRARWRILHNERLGKVEGEGPWSFTPKGYGRPAGLMEVFEVEKRFRSASVALLPVGKYYVNIEVHSTKLSPVQLSGLLKRAIGETRWGPDNLFPAAEPIADCSKPLAIKAYGKYAPLDPAEEGVASSGFINRLDVPMAFDSRPRSEIEMRGTFCRDPEASEEYGVYQWLYSPPNYLLALGADGRAIEVRRGVHTIIRDKELPANFQIIHYGLTETTLYPFFETIPRPDQIHGWIETTKPIQTREAD